MECTSHLSPRPCLDLILWEKSVDELELLWDFIIRDDVNAAICHKIIDTIPDNWDSFSVREDVHAQ